ncbi:MAG: hypothetical protein PWP23_2883 [Candidatus Sumerlaeota bacterium]|nr:hypothetical protein [Candidatus Sumerlaeota bacterium]
MAEADAIGPPRLTAGAFLRRHWLALALLPALIGLLLPGHATLIRCAGSIGFPYQLDREEGFLLEQGLRLADGETIYPSLKDYPYTVGNYPPVYPVLLAVGTLVAGDSLAPGRILAGLAAFLIAGLILYAVLREPAGGLVGGLIAVGLFLGTWALSEWIAFVRVDLPALALGMAGFVLGTGRQSRLRLAAVVALFSLAFFTKQTQIIAPLALFGAMLWRRQWRGAGVFAAAMAGTCAVFLGLLVLATAGEFWRHTVAYNANAMYWNQVPVWLAHLRDFSGFALVALIPAAGFLVWSECHRPGPVPEEPEGPHQPSRSLVAPASLLYLGLAGLSLLTTAKAGSASNYLLEFLAVAALVTGLGISRAAELLQNSALGPRRRRTAVAAAVVLALLLLCHGASGSLNIGGTIARHRLFRQPPPPELREQLALVELHLSEFGSPVLAEEPIFAIRTGSPVLYQPFIMTQLAREGKWDPAPFVADLEEGRFGAILTNQDLARDGHFPGFTEEMRRAILRAYRLREQIGGHFIYVPLDADAKGPLRQFAWQQ